MQLPDDLDRHVCSRAMHLPNLTTVEVPVERIRELREAYRRAMNCQIVHDSWHARGFTRSYLLQAGETLAGYGSVGGVPSEPRHTVKEFFLEPSFEHDPLPFFRQLAADSGARFIEAQTNDKLLHAMLESCCTRRSSDTLLFAAGASTSLEPPRAGTEFRPITADDHRRVFEHTHEPVGEWALDVDGVIVATGGLAFHYNPPYGDIYMEVAPSERQQGFGSYLVQELKRLCYSMERVPAARCHESNEASQRTLQRAGMLMCGRIVRGEIDKA